MRLGVNVVRLTRPFTGVGRYVECLLREWAAMELPFQEVVLYAPAPVRGDLAVFPQEYYRTEIVGSLLPDPVWEWSSLRRAARECDVLFCPSYTIPVGYRGRCAVTYLGPATFPHHDLRALRGGLYDLLYRYSARRADCVFTVSHAVKERVVNVYEVPQERVSVTYLAASDAFRPVLDEVRGAEVRQRYFGSDAPFILFVGKLSGRHFVPDLLEAFATAVRHSKLPHRLLLVGPDVLNLRVEKRARRIGLADRVVHIPFVQHLELPALYSAAELFVYPASEAEGFGIPVLEAMACGTPVISTDQGSISEFARDSALLVNRSTVQELAEAIERLAADAELRECLRRRGLETARRIRWRVTAEKTMQRLWAIVQRDHPRR